VSEPQATIGNARRFGVTELLVYCHQPMCWHQSTLPAARFADDVVIQSLKPRLRCSRCGQLGNVDVRPDWPTRRGRANQFATVVGWRSVCSSPESGSRSRHRGSSP
jgi:hypothetical protein